MAEPALFAVAARRLDWLTARQALVAGNVAHAHVPGHRPRDLRPFREVFERAALAPMATHALHMGAGPAASATALRPVEVANQEVRLSGNTVRLDQELLKAGAIGSEAAFTAGIVRSFHRFLLAAAKG